jgi:hypothetical protein
MGTLYAPSWTHPLVTSQTVDRDRRRGLYGAHRAGLSLLSSRRVTGCHGHQSYLGGTDGMDRGVFPEGRADVDRLCGIARTIYMKTLRVPRVYILRQKGLTRLTPPEQNELVKTTQGGSVSHASLD